MTSVKEKTTSNKLVKLQGLSKEELIDRVTQLETHVTQLQNVIAKSRGSDARRHLNQRSFDFNKYNTRHVALRFAYLGWDYQGFAAQEDTNRTIEAVLFDALIKTRLIESRETSNYHRCGRTDKGVSAFSQVISIDLRTNLLEGHGVKVRENGTASERAGDKTVEIRYIHFLNKVLPPEIRVLAWCPVDHDFSARFSCKQRTYKYYFPRGNLDPNRMLEAAKKLVGHNDYRNLCKMDVANGVVNFKRTILSVDVKPCRFSSLSRETNNLRLPSVDKLTNDFGSSDKHLDSEVVQPLPIETVEPRLLGNSCPIADDDRGGAVALAHSGYEMFELTIVGNAFLWHQIRCIVAVLFLVGEGKEEPEVITELLDVEKNPQKPQYTMASELPLILFDCEFEGLEWLYDFENQEETIENLQELWMKQAVKNVMLRKMLDQMTQPDNSHSNGEKSICHQAHGLIPGNRARKYKPLLDRERCECLENRVQHFAKKRKLDTESNMDQF